MIGKNLSHYKLIAKLGEGGMGEVYRARDTKLDRDVALKVLPEDLARDPERRRRFEREAKAVAALRHPNIVMIHSVEEVGGVHFIVMELVEGKPLSDSLPDDGFPLKRFFGYAIELADALGAAHAKGIAHRDLKPANIMIDADGRLRVLDFGLAKLFQPDLDSDKTVGVDSETGEGRILGTVSYMSPEQAEGQSIDHRSDVFSLGIILYEMATGKRPFSGKTNISTLSAIIKDNPPSVSELKHTLPRHLGRIINRCLAKEPERRYQSVLDVRNELEGLMGEVSSGDVHIPAAERRPRIVSGKTARIGALAVVGLVAVVAAIALWPRAQDGPTQVSSSGSGAGVSIERSIAVLPFANLSDDKNNEFFSDGLAEELLNLLAKIPGLHVAARTSSFHFKGHTGSVAEIGEQLNVATILEGSVRRSGNRVRVTAQLVKAADGFHMWSDTYDRELDDIFAIQEEIATQVVEALKITLMGEDATKLAQRPTDNVEAYDAYLLGLQRMARRQSDALQEAAAYYERAVGLDPGFAQAYAQLGVTYLLLEDYGGMAAGEAQAAAADMIGRALEIDDQLSEAYGALGLLKSNKGELEEAEKAYQRAIELNPNHALAHMWYATLMRGKDHDRAWELINKSLELDPLSAVANTNVGYWLVDDGKLNEAVKQFQHVIEIEPGSPLGYSGLTRAYDVAGKPDEALEWMRKTVEVDPASLTRRMDLGWTLYQNGRTEDAVETFDGIIAMQPGFAGPYGAIATIHRSRGRLADAVRWGQKAYQRDRQNMQHYFQLTQLYLDLDDEATAMQWVEKCEGTFPDSPFPEITRAFVYLYRGELEEAGEILQRVGALAPLWFRQPLAAMDLRQGRRDDAVSRFADEFHDVLDGGDPEVDSGNLESATFLALALPEKDARRDALVAECDRFVTSQSALVRRNRYPWAMFQILILRGRITEALSEAERVMAAGGVQDWWLHDVNPFVAPVSDDPRWKALIARTREDVAQMRAELASEGLAVQ